jgi:hypothetical protein
MFPEPCFSDDFSILDAKLAGSAKDQLKMTFEREDVELTAVRFRHSGPLPGMRARLVYKLSRRYDKWGNEQLQPG